MEIQTSSDPVTRARELGAEIVAAADDIERTRRIPEPLLGQLHASRLFRMLLPRSAGGDETEPALYVAAIEELARHDASIAWNAFVANSSCRLPPIWSPRLFTPSSRIRAASWPGDLQTLRARARLTQAIA